MSSVKLSRLRRKSPVRDLVSQTELNAGNIILPYFVTVGENVAEPIGSMPGVCRLSIDNIIKDLRGAGGIRAVLIFGITDEKDEHGTSGFAPQGIVQEAVRAIKEEFSDLIVMTDVCLCGYTSHGHCGIFKSGEDIRTSDKRAVMDHEKTLEALAKIALSHAEAGADMVAPSAMMDGQVKAIRASLDDNGFEDVSIMAYSAKFASNFYGPFRDALDSSPGFGDRKSYQMDFRNSDEAMREIKQDIDEGADIIMVKPALAYMDIIYRAKQEFNVPVAAYNVSGEYSMIKGISGGDKSAEKDLALEVLTSLKRAGADMIITYFGREAVEWLK